MSFRFRVEQLLTLITTRAGPNVTGEALTHVATEVEVLEEESVRLCKVITISNICRLRFLTYNHLKVHDFPSFSLFHLDGPGAGSLMLCH